MRRSLMRRMLLSITLQIVVEEDVAVDRIADNIVNEEDVAVDHKGEQKHGLWLHTEKIIVWLEEIVIQTL